MPLSGFPADGSFGSHVFVVVGCVGFRSPFPVTLSLPVDADRVWVRSPLGGVRGGCPPRYVRVDGFRCWLDGLIARSFRISTSGQAITRAVRASRLETRNVPDRVAGDTHAVDIRLVVTVHNPQAVDNHLILRGLTHVR